MHLLYQRESGNLFIAAVIHLFVHNGKVLAIKLGVFFEELDTVVLKVSVCGILLGIILELCAPYFNVLVFVVKGKFLAIGVDIRHDVLE